MDPHCVMPEGETRLSTFILKYRVQDDPKVPGDSGEVPISK